MKQTHTKLGKKMYHLLSKWEDSGMSLKTFSNTVDVSYYKLKYWKYKFKQAKQEAIKKPINPLQDKADFIPVEIPITATGFAGIEIIFPNTVKMTCPSGIGIEELKTLIKLF
ncbi:MAG: hypothetical protein L3J83_09395 [Proteobacteria bacterium]|nr:hypothetical protein [Pseudomonadota bacterium]